MTTLTGQELAGRDVAVIGGTGNVGFFLVDGFLRAGARVIVPSRDPSKLDRLMSRIGQARTRQVVPLVGDIGTPEGAAALHAQIADITGRLAATASAPASWHQTTSMLRAGFADFKQVIETRLYPHYLAAETFLPLLDRDGAYTTINGPAGRIQPPPPGLGAIATVAAAQAKLIEAIGAETGGHPRVNDVVMMAFLGPDGTRPGSPLAGEQVADFIVALSTDRASGVHGRSIDLRDPRQVADALAGRFATRETTSRENAS